MVTGSHSPMVSRPALSAWTAALRALRAFAELRSRCSSRGPRSLLGVGGGAPGAGARGAQYWRDGLPASRPPPVARTGPRGRTLCRAIGGRGDGAAAGLSKAHFSREFRRRVRRAAPLLPAHQAPGARRGTAARARTTRCSDICLSVGLRASARSRRASRARSAYRRAPIARRVPAAAAYRARSGLHRARVRPPADSARFEKTGRTRPV